MNKLTSVTIISGVLIASMFGTFTALVLTNHLKMDSLSSTNPTQTTFQYMNTEQTSTPIQTNQVIIPLQEHYTNNYCDLLHTCIEPAVIQIHVGDRVTWQNKDSIDHHLVFGVPYSGGSYGNDVILPSDQLGIQEFDNVGAYQYYDRNDPRINGEVIVK